jgi:FkbM family methyltransferase
MQDGIEGASLNRSFVRRLRVELYRARHQGFKRYARTAWRRRTVPQAPQPRANAPFDIGADVPIVLHESTLPGVRSHLVDDGGGTEELDALKRLARGHSTFLDIGAAAGVFSAAFCALTGNRAYAFEPSSAMFKRLESLVGLNPRLQITPVNLALGAVAGSQLVTVSSNSQFRAAGTSDTDTETMSVETLDGFVNAHEMTPDFAKVDVEGMELQVLRGGAETFTQSIDTLMLEVHSKRLVDGNVGDVQALLVEYGFALYTLAFEPISDLAGHVASGPPAWRRATNLVCLKGSVVSDIGHTAAI